MRPVMAIHKLNLNLKTPGQVRDDNFVGDTQIS